jgi:hypothetical protein
MARTYQSVRRTASFEQVRAYAAANDGRVTIAEIAELLEIHYLVAQRRTAHWRTVGKLVYTGTFATYGLPDVVEESKDRRWRWRELRAALDTHRSLNAREFATISGSSWYTASAFLRFCLARGQLVRVASGRYAMGSAS